MPHEPNLTAYLRGPDDVDDKQSVSSFVDGNLAPVDHLNVLDRQGQ